MNDIIQLKLKRARAELTIRRRQMNSAVRSYRKVESLIANLERKNERKANKRAA